MEPIFATSRTRDLAGRATPDELRGRLWERRAHGLWRPTGMAVDEADGRVADAIGLLTEGCVLGGWAALRFQGNEAFDGGGQPVRRVLVHCGPGAQLRRRAVVEPCRAAVWDHEITRCGDVPVTTMARATYDEMRLAPSVRAAVVALDSAVSRVTNTARTSLRAVQQVIDSHRKTRGIVQAKRALLLGSERSASPMETRTRLVARLDADLDGLLVNAPVFGPSGELLGVADLLDERTGLVIEVDGAQHREEQHHADDNVREERFERAGMVVVRVTALDLRDVRSLVARIRLGHRDAAMSLRRDWTLDQPAWFRSWEPGSAGSDVRGVPHGVSAPQTSRPALRMEAVRHNEAMSPVMRQSEKLRDVLYDIRGPVSARAAQLEAEGHRILKLNIGNPQPFGFDAPAEILQDVIAGLPTAQGYSDSRGIQSARRAVVHHYQLQDGFPAIDIDDVWLGNGVSELIQIALQALLNNGDEVLIPVPDYPLWTAVTNLAGGRPVHYRCDEDNEWNPDLADLESKITDRTKVIVVINPNNPTGAVYSRETLTAIADLARKHDLVLMADEIYDKILYDDAVHIPMASIAPDVLTLTFNGLSKAYRVCGYRAGWLVVTGPLERAQDYLEGITLLASMRLCPNVPAQNAIQVALGGYQSIKELILPGGRLLEQRDTAVNELRKIPGVSVVAPRGALYAFPRLDPEVHPIKDDQQFVLDLLMSEKILLTQGTGFNWPDPDHLRIVTLPWSRDLAEAIQRMGNFLGSYRQD